MASTSTPTVALEISQMQKFIRVQAQIQDQLVAKINDLQGTLIVVQGQKAIQKPIVQMHRFAARKIKLDLPPKFMGKPNELLGWTFQVEQYCSMVGLAKPTNMVRLGVSRLEEDVFTWCRQLVHHGESYQLGTLEWSDFKSEIVDAFVDVDRKLKFCRKLASLRQQNSIANYIKQFWQTVLELGEQAPDDSALLFMFTEGLKPDVQMQVLLAWPQFLTEAEQVAERADMALFSSGKCQQQPQQFKRLQLQPWQQRQQQYKFVRPPPPPPRQVPVLMELGAIQGQGQLCHQPAQCLPAR